MIYWILLILLPLVVFVIFLLFIHRELKQLRGRVKELEQINAAKDRLLTVIGHDLNNAINNLQPAISLYKSAQVASEEKQSILDSIEEQVYFASSTLQSLLNWGKLQLKGITIQPDYFNAADIIRDKLGLIKGVAQKKGQTIINRLPAKLDIYADVNQFRFIMRNLLSNAIKFSRVSGTIEIDVQTDRQPDYIVFSVKDSGMGIPKEKLNQIFQPFTVSTEGTSQEKGNGIGLMLCKEYAQKNGGDIWVKSEDRVGTTFYVALRMLDYPPLTS